MLRSERMLVMCWRVLAQLSVVPILALAEPRAVKDCRLDFQWIAPPSHVMKPIRFQKGLVVVGVLRMKVRRHLVDPNLHCMGVSVAWDLEGIG